MVSFRWLPLVMALTATSTLVACNTSPAMPMGKMATGNMAAPDHMAKMDAQMKAMKDGMAMMGDQMSAAPGR